MADRVVLDASAILAALQNEPGGSVISALLDAADVLIAVSAVNHSEVVSKLVRDGVSEADVLVLTSSFVHRVHPFSLIQAHTCGSLIAKTGRLGSRWVTVPV